jgi:ParB family transcriptional regulator, chromosome partitioning protein
VPQSQRDAAGPPLTLAVGLLFEDPHNPRTEFPEAELNELAEDVAQHGIVQRIVVHSADAAGRYQIHFGAKRFCAALRAGLPKVPVVIRWATTDPDTAEPNTI